MANFRKFPAVFLLFSVGVSLTVLPKSQAEMQTSTVSHELPKKPFWQNRKLAVEIALFCDNDFGSLFYHNETKMLEYWEAVFYDVELRFRTLPSFNFVFRLNYFRTLQASEQPFEEKARPNQDHVSVEQAHYGFREWIRNQTGIPLTFDIAILALGSPPSTTLQGIANLYRICTESRNLSNWTSTITFSVRGLDPAGTLAHEIAHVLGAPHDSKILRFVSDCAGGSTENYLMHDNGIIQNRHFFSNCTDLVLQLTLAQAECLAEVKRDKDPIIDTNRLTTHSLTNYQQCQILTNHSTVLVNNANCGSAECQLGSGSIHQMLPFNGSPCKEKREGVCYRDLCIEQGILLGAITGNKCLIETSDLGHNKITMTDCVALQKNIVHGLHFRNTRENGIFLLEYSWDPNSNFGLRCLTLSSNSIHENIWSAEFENCSPVARYGWDIKTSSENSTDFMLLHRSTKKCLKLDGLSGALVGSDNCSGSDLGIWWKLLLTNGSTLTHHNYKEFIDGKNIQKPTQPTKPKRQSYFPSVGAILKICLVVLAIKAVCFLFVFMCTL